MYPRLMFFGEQYAICWDVAQHGEMGHAGWQTTPIEGRKYFPRPLADGLEGPLGGVLDFTRPTPKKAA